MADVSQIKLPNNNTYNIKDALLSSYDTGANDTAGRWTVTVPRVTELYEGLTIRVYLNKSYNSTFNTINVNGLGEKLVKYRRDGQLTSHVPQYANITLTYHTNLAAYSISNAYCDPVNNANYRGAWAANTSYAIGDSVLQSSKYYICKKAHTSGASWATTNWNASTTPYTSLAVPTSATVSITDGWLLQTTYNDGNDVVTVRSQYPRFLAGGNGLKQYCLFGRIMGDKFSAFTTSHGTGTKAFDDTNYFDPTKIYYYNSSSNLSSGSYTANNSVDFQHSLVDLRYTLNGVTTDATSVIVANKPVYIIFDRTTENGGYYKLKSPYFTQEPNDQDAIYALVAYAYDTYRCDLIVRNSLFTFDGNSIVPFTVNALTQSVSGQTLIFGEGAPDIPVKSFEYHFKPNQKLGIPSPTNILNLSPVTQIGISQSSKNLLDPNTLALRVINTSGTERISFAPLTLPAGTYTFSRTGTTESIIISTLPDFELVYSVSGETATFTLSEEKTIIVRTAKTALPLADSKFQLEVGDTATSYVIPYNSSVITLPDNDTYYGGTYSLTNVTNEYAFVEFDGSEDEGWVENNGRARISGFEDRLGRNETRKLYGYSNMFPTTGDDDSLAPYATIRMTSDTSGNLEILDYQTYFGVSSLADFRTWLSTHPLQFCYRISICPVTFIENGYDLTTLKGKNCINCWNGKMDLTYFLDTPVVDAIASLSSDSLAKLTDTSISNPSAGDLVTYDGSAWVNTNAIGLVSHSNNKTQVSLNTDDTYGGSVYLKDTLGNTRIEIHGTNGRFASFNDNGQQLATIGTSSNSGFFNVYNANGKAIVNIWNGLLNGQIDVRDSSGNSKIKLEGGTGKVTCAKMSVSQPAYTLSKTSGAWNVASTGPVAYRTGNVVHIKIKLVGTGTAVAAGGDTGFVGTLSGGPLPVLPIKLVEYFGNNVLIMYVESNGATKVRLTGSNLTISSGSEMEFSGTFIVND